MNKAAIIAVVLAVAGVGIRYIPTDVVDVSNPAHKATIDYASRLAEAFRATAAAIEQSDMSDREANAMLGDLQMKARRAAFIPIDEELQLAVVDGKWDRDKAAATMRRLADGFERVR